MLRAIEEGLLTVDAEGRIWRWASRGGDRWKPGTVRVLHHRPRRAENDTGAYLQVRVMYHGRRLHVLAHRLVYRHLRGEIPPGLTINHKNGQKKDNRPDNLEIATYAEQVKHAREVLGRQPKDQNGAKNAMSKLTEKAVREIRRRRAAGEKLRSIASDFGISDRAISKIALGQRWAFCGA